MVYEGNGTVFIAPNHHSKNCGEPPAIRAEDPDTYYGYFENEHGEQLVFVRDGQKDHAELRMGDSCWDVMEVRSGTTGPIIMGAAERLWLEACWIAAQAKKR